MLVNLQIMSQILILQDDATFTITVDGKTFHFQARDSEEREKWIRALEETVLRHNQMRRPVSQLGSNTGGRSKWANTNGKPPTIQDFDKKLAETDSYLQLLLNQVSGLRAKMDVNMLSEMSANSTGVGSTDDSVCNSETLFSQSGDNSSGDLMTEQDMVQKVEDRKTKYEDIAEKALGMTESIKHAIVLLQIAKNASTPPQHPDQVKHFKSIAPNTSTAATPATSHTQNSMYNSISESPVRRPHPNEILDPTNFLPGQVINPPIATGIPYEKAKEGKEECDNSCNLGGKAVNSTNSNVAPTTAGNRIQFKQMSPNNVISNTTTITSGAQQLVQPKKSSLKIAQEIPATSYSSDSDEFYDAESDDGDLEFEEEFDGRQGSKCSMIDVDNVTSTTRHNPDLSLGLVNVDAYPNPCDMLSPMTPGFDENDENIDYDKLYEEDEEEGEVDMKSHGSVITHLLSQVRIGMDLTRIVLPTFILERRSLLEMYSDFFAHPDLFLDVANGKNPEERMIKVLKWYLSSFHAGRKSAIAKKPYNPILGETFRCHWKVPSVDSVDQSQEFSSQETNAKSLPSAERQMRDAIDVAKESALPECSPNELTFIAEQVSHHPPISAFYAEHINKRITTSAHIYTKSSFLGMSVSEVITVGG